MEVPGPSSRALQTETQCLEAVFRGVAEWQQGGNMLPLCCLVVAALLPPLFIHPRREATKPATGVRLRGIYLPAAAQLALTGSFPVVATFLADFDPGKIRPQIPAVAGCFLWLPAIHAGRPADFPSEELQDRRSREGPCPDTPIFMHGGAAASGSAGLFENGIEEPNDKLLLFARELADLLQAQGQLWCGTRTAAGRF